MLMMTVYYQDASGCRWSFLAADGICLGTRLRTVFRRRDRTTAKGRVGL
jgi:hypothetical protein